MEARRITAATHPLIKQAVAIARRRWKEESGLFLAEGPHLVMEAVTAAAPIRWLFFSPAFRHSAAGERLLAQLSRQGQGELIEVPESLLRKISDTENPQGIAAVLAFSETSLSSLLIRDPALLAICDAIGDPGNLGTLIRIADAAAADAVILLPGCCDPLAPKVVRATAGSLFHLPVLRAGPEQLIDFLNRRGIALLATDLKGERSLYEADLKKPCALLIGNEARGTSPFFLERAQLRLKIPMPGQAESLNAAISAALCLFEAVRQRTSPSQ
ncbi:MAG: RNA methyltransferase [Deltaproteobacteria bacterium]|nr:RNA methyltransferase [Deltaproteobacteria bacterium]